MARWPLSGLTSHTLGKLGMFVSLVVVEVWLAHGLSSSATIHGYVDTHSFGVASTDKGLVARIDVALGEVVTAGQVIGEMDPGTIDDEIAIETAERRRVLAGLVTGAGSGSAGSSDTELPASAESLRVIDLRLEQLAAKKDALRLKSPVDGIVETIDVRPGDAIGPNSPVATVVTPDARRVIACIPETRLHDIEVGTAAEVRSLDQGHAISGAVESLTPAIATLPPRCQMPLRKIPSVGRLAVVLLDESADLLPGQTQLVSFASEKRALPALPTVETRKAPIAMDVPAELVASSRFEPSGLVWVESLDRYLVVSDETGIQGGADHPPWLFAMSRRGVVDADPIVLENLDHLDDVESIAAAEGGAIWLAASQSQSERGNRPAAREQIVRIVPAAGPAGAGFRADGKVRLAKLLDDAPPETRAALGVPDTRALDIEAMAWRAGALYLGLKSPVDDHHRAMIWRVASPDRLLAGDLAGAGLAVWARVALAVEVEGKSVDGGFADLIFLDDTSLLAGVSASGISGKKQTGRLVALTGKPDALVVKTLETFPLLRPEGLALSPDPHRLMIVFDRGKETPKWHDEALPNP